MISSILKQDLDQVVAIPEITWNDLKHATVLVTGATGLIGSILVGALSTADKKHQLHLNLIAHGRNPQKADALLSKYNNIQFISGDIRKPIVLGEKKVDYILHCAAITSSADMLSKPVNVITTAIDGTKNILDLAVEKQSISVVYLSSMEVYGQASLSVVSESDLGYLDLSNPRNSYPESKRLCENLCAAYLAEHGTPVKIARLARTFGAGVPNDSSDMRVAMQFARKAMCGENIVLHTAGSSISNCCYTADAIAGLLFLMLKGTNGEAYNIVNSDASITIREMASVVANDVCGGKIAVNVEIPPDIIQRGYLADITMTISADKMKRLGWRPQYGIEEMYRRMIMDWRESESSRSRASVQ